MEPIVLGRTYRDVITGFIGVAIGHVEYLTGCNQTLISPRASADNKAGDSHWYDDQRMQMDTSAGLIVLDNSKAPGHDKAAPTK